MCGFVRARISLAIVRSNNLILRCPWDKGVRIWKRPELTDGAVKALIAPWQGYTARILTGKTGRDEFQGVGYGEGYNRSIARETSESAYNWYLDREGKTEIVDDGNRVEYI